MPTPKSIAHYQITGILGEGGMGVVYRATDTKLNREVAIKVLTGELTSLTREAQLLATLNHPNIAAVYGVEENALVLELVEGPTLAGPLSFEEALPLIHQLIDAIEYAHEKGIIHRDLKPANIKLTTEGKIKVLDFGLAKMAQAQRGTDVTLTLGNSQSGVIMGTPAYMAPEQARGKQIDKRADIWAFGVILYELLTGQRLFPADNIGDALAQTLTKPIDFDKVPPQARNLLRRALDRDSKTRLRDIGDARSYLTEPAPAPLPHHKQSKLPWLVAAAALLSTTAALFVRPTPLQAPVVRSTLEFTSGYSISPNGLYLLRTTLLSSPSEPITLRRLDEITPHPLIGTEGGRFPAWAPDSSAFVFHANGQLRLYIVATGESRAVAPAAAVSGISLRGGATAGDIIYSAKGKIHHSKLPSGATRELPLNLPPDASTHRPSFLPEGDGFVFLLSEPRSREDSLYKSSLSATTSARLLDTEVRVAFARHPRTNAWHVFYVQPRQTGFGGTLLTAPIDPRSGEFRSEPVPVVPSISPIGNTRASNFDVSNNGLFVYRATSAALPIWALRWFDRHGRILSAPGESASIHSFDLAPDQSRAAILTGHSKSEIAVLDFKSGRTTRLSNSPNDTGNPIWSPDGRSIYYSLNPDPGKPSEIIRHAADGASPPEVIGTFADGPSSLQAITPDGRYLLANQRRGIVSLDLRAPPPAKPVLSIPFAGRVRTQSTRLAVSPNGKWLLVQGEAQRTGFFIAWPPPPAGDPVIHPVANLALSFLFFRPDGREICGVTPDLKGTVECQVITEVNGVPRLDEPVPQFAAATPVRGNAKIGAFSADGTKILLLVTNRPEENATQLLTDWTALLPKESPR